LARIPIADELLSILSAVMIGLVRRDDADLTARGLSILLMIDTMPGPHTVRGMAEHLNVSKPAVTRTLDRLEVLGLVRRDVDTADRRSVLVRATKVGAAYVARVGRLATKASA
jgi:DNA-binding MarR family transcriptional regulator